MPIEEYAKVGCDPLKAAAAVAAGIPLGRVLDWLGKQWRRNIAIRRVSAIPDYLLKDAGVARRNADWITDERVKRLRWGTSKRLRVSPCRGERGTRGCQPVRSCGSG